MYNSNHIKVQYKGITTFLNICNYVFFFFFRCTVEKLLSATVIPFKGILKGHSNQVFEITIISYNQPAILTIMFNVSYTLVCQNENYNRSLRNFEINKEKLDGVFIINECGHYKPVRLFNSILIIN